MTMYPSVSCTCADLGMVRLDSVSLVLIELKLVAKIDLCLIEIHIMSFAFCVGMDYSFGYGLILDASGWDIMVEVYLRELVSVYYRWRLPQNRVDMSKHLACPLNL